MEIIATKIDSLKPYPNNPRKGDIKALAESLKNHGQYKPIVVQMSTGQILAGNHLWEAAKSLGWKLIDTVSVDVTDEHAARIVVADNRLADLGTYDNEKLLELLGDIDLAGTGYNSNDVDDLLALIDEVTEIPANQHGQQEGVTVRPTLAERAERYAERTIRLLMAEYPNHQYVWVIERLTELREQYGVDSNAEAILQAVANETGLEVPKL